MRVTAFMSMDDDDVPNASINEHGRVVLSIDNTPGHKTGGDIFMTPAQAEQIVNALVEALAALKVPK